MRRIGMFLAVAVVVGLLASGFTEFANATGLSQWWYPKENAKFDQVRYWSTAAPGIPDSTTARSAASSGSENE